MGGGRAEGVPEGHTTASHDTDSAPGAYAASILIRCSWRRVTRAPMRAGPTTADTACRRRASRALLALIAASDGEPVQQASDTSNGAAAAQGKGAFALLGLMQHACVHGMRVGVCNVHADTQGRGRAACKLRELGTAGDGACMPGPWVPWLCRPTARSCVFPCVPAFSVPYTLPAHQRPSHRGPSAPHTNPLPHSLPPLHPQVDRIAVKDVQSDELLDR